MNESLSLTIRHHTGFNYDGLAKSSYNEARMTPVTGASQEVRNAHVAVQPVVPTGRRYAAFMADVLARVREGRPPAISLDDFGHAMALADRAYAMAS